MDEAGTIFLGWRDSGCVAKVLLVSVERNATILRPADHLCTSNTIVLVSFRNFLSSLCINSMGHIVTGSVKEVKNEDHCTVVNLACSGKKVIEKLPIFKALI